MKRVLGALVATLALSACGPEPIQQWVVAAVNRHVVAGPSAECDDLIPPNDAKTFNNEDVIFTIYQGAKDKYYLDPGSGEVLEGAKTSGTYTFNAQSQSVTLDSVASPHIQLTTTHTEQISVTPDGSKVKGNYTVEDKKTCEKKDPAGDCTFVLPKVHDCISTGDLQGSQLETPEYKQSAPTPGGPGPSPDTH